MDSTKETPPQHWSEYEETVRYAAWVAHRTLPGQHYLEGELHVRQQPYDPDAVVVDEDGQWYTPVLLGGAVPPEADPVLVVADPEALAAPRGAGFAPVRLETD